MKYKILFFLQIGIFYTVLAQISNGSTGKVNVTTRFTTSIKLDNKLKQTSGLIKWNNTFWTHNDDTDTNLYALDTISGKILSTYAIANVTNTDWEEIQQDDNHIYIGDFGNNAKGNRTDLNILKIDKQTLLAGSPVVEKINFSYDNQKNFDEQKANLTNFDCEAFVVSKDSIYLFTKQWLDKSTSIFVLPKLSGSYAAKFKSNFKIKGLVTGANFIEHKNQLALCGYTRDGKPFITIFYDFVGFDFFSGKVKKIKIKPRFLQIEAINSQDGNTYHLTCEHLKFLTINKPQQLLQLDLREIDWRFVKFFK